MKTNFDQFENDRMIEDPMNYKAGIFYFNPKDSRIMVPKRYKLTAYTLNFARLYAYLLISGIIVVILIVNWLSR